MVDQEEARQAQLLDHAQFFFEAHAGLFEPHVAAADAAALVIASGAVALLQSRLADRAQAFDLARVLGAGVAVAEVAGEIEVDPLGDLGRPGTACGCSAKRRAISSGGAITCELLPRRSGSVSSSEALCLSATKTSCSVARSRAWTWTFPVATVGTPTRSAIRSSAMFSPRSCLWNGRWTR